MIRAMLRHCTLILAACWMLTACQERVTTTLEEQQLLERLTRDPNLIVTAIERDDDRRLLVTTTQGNVTARYLFAPDVAGEKKLNIHRIGDASRIDEGASNRPEALRVR